MNVLNRESILAADDVRRELVEVPEWGGSVYVSTISAAAGLTIINDADEENGRVVMGVGLLLARAIVDEEGNRIFTPEDIPALMEKSRRAIDRVTEAALRLNNFSGQAVEAAEKNSNGEAFGDSPSASPLN